MAEILSCLLLRVKIRAVLFAYLIIRSYTFYSFNKVWNKSHNHAFFEKLFLIFNINIRF